MKVGPQADRFGEFIMANFRDAAIDHVEGLLAAHWKAPSSQSLQSELQKLTPKQRKLVRRCVIESVDRGLHAFLFALGEAHDFDSGIAVMVDGKDIATQSDGLHGESFGDAGWFARFSKHGQPQDPA